MWLKLTIIEVHDDQPVTFFDYVNMDNVIKIREAVILDRSNASMITLRDEMYVWAYESPSTIMDMLGNGP